MVDLLPYFVVLWDLKIKSKSSGLHDSNFIFFVATEKTKQKKAWVRVIDIVTHVLDLYICAALGMSGS